ncbi:MAG: choice-of-anchor D domain-containing protein [Deltaproteobacteria bacterium]|nr:choice-of-anchor D domain-containing protein [Deltaproteobacteria bacterium]
MMKRNGLSWKNLLVAGVVLALAVLPACGGGGGGGGEGGGEGGGRTLKKYPVIEVEPANLCDKAGEKLVNCSYKFDQGEVQPGSSSFLDVKVVNTGEFKLTLRSVTLNYVAPEGANEAGLPSFDLMLPGDLADALAGDPAKYELAPLSDPSDDLPEEVTIRVVYTRYDDGFDRNASLSIKSDASNSPDVNVALSLSEGKPAISVSPEVVDFGQVFAGEEEEKNVNILNPGTANLEITGFRFSGSQFFTLVVGGTEYPVSQETTEGITFDQIIELEMNTSFFFKVRFAPVDDQKADGTLVIYSNDDNYPDGTTVLIKGNQTGPCIAVNPAQVKFGGKKIGDLAILPLVISSCGDAPLQIFDVQFATGSSADFDVDLNPLDHEPSAEDPIIVPIGDDVTINVKFVPDEENPTDVNGSPIPDLGTLLIENNSFYQTKEVPVSGFGALVLCPTAVIQIAEGAEVIPQTVLHLYGDQSYAATGTIAKWDWSVDQPLGSQSVFIPSNTFPNPTFEVNVAGKYTFNLTVYDEQNIPSCAPDTFEVVVIPDEAIHIELLWHTPEDADETDEGPEAGSDLDLHFTHPWAGGPDLDGDGQPDGWFDQPFDAFWFNAHPEWGSFDPSIDDNPGLDRDDTDGAGPENINLNIPEDVVYKVGVHYWNDHGYGASYATVRVYIYSQLVFELPDVKLVDSDMWEVCTVEWPSGKVQVITDPSGQYKITPNYQNPFFFQD